MLVGFIVLYLLASIGIFFFVNISLNNLLSNLIRFFQ